MTFDNDTELLGALADITVGVAAATLANITLAMSPPAVVIVFIVAYVLSPASAAVKATAAVRGEGRGEVENLSAGVLPASQIVAGMLLLESDSLAAAVVDVAETGLGNGWVRIRTATGRQHLFAQAAEVTVLSHCDC